MQCFENFGGGVQMPPLVASLGLSSKTLYPHFCYYVKR